ncbi:hypothetical protein [Nocardioides sp.]|uniref:hypothetical protein n=1 Tax=Nocardioides sp. TaxID=35761 RepID=UPI003D1215E8
MTVAPRTSPPHPERTTIEVERRPTTTRMWVALIVLDLAMSAALIPSLLEDLRARVPADIVEGVGDDRLLDLSLRVGAYLSVPVHAVALIVIALVARSLERHVFRASRTLTPSLRFGAFWLLVAVTLVPIRVLSLSGMELPSGWFIAHLVVATAVMLCVFWTDWVKLGSGSKGVTLATSVLLVAAISWGK